MNVLILGARGAVGSLVLDETLRAGHRVTALARDAAKLQTRDPSIVVVQGQATQGADLARVLPGQDAVICAIGARTLARNTARSDVTRARVAEMTRCGVRRVICVSSIVPVVLRHPFVDAERADHLLAQSDLDWTIVRPASMTNAPAQGISIATDMSARLAHLKNSPC